MNIVVKNKPVFQTTLGLAELVSMESGGGAQQWAPVIHVGAHFEPVNDAILIIRFRTYPAARSSR